MSEVFITRKGGGGKASAPELLITDVGGSWIEFEVTNTDQSQPAQIFLLANYDPNSEEEFDFLAIQSGKVITVAAGDTATEFLQGLDPATTHTISAQAAVIKKLPSSIVTTDPTDLLQTGIPVPTLGTPIDATSDTSLQIPVTNNDPKIPLVIKVAATTSTATPSVYPFEITVQPNSTSNITITGLTLGTSYYYHAIATDGDVESNNIFIGPFVKQEVPLYAFTTTTFTNGGAEGTIGPTITQARNGIGNPSWASTFLTMPIAGFQQWTVPASRRYRLTVAGAQGGSGRFNQFYGGRGNIIVGEINLQKGENLLLLVGQRGGSVSNGSSGGGGGSFVFRTSRTQANLLIAAGGGSGGGGNSSPINGQNGQTGTSGGSNSSGGAGGTNGAGGPANGGGGGGAGINSSGGNGADTAAGGLAIIASTGRGGRGGNCSASQAGSFNFQSLGNDQGGFGGGGGGEWCSMGGVGGGGGFSGGAGNSSSTGIGGGGGSFIASSVTTISNGASVNGSTTLGERTNLHGFITIQPV